MPALPRMTQTVTITRRVGVTDAEGRPTGAGTVTATVLGFVMELSAIEAPAAGTLGESTIAQGVVPLGTDVIEQDTLSLAYPSGMTRSYRVFAVHDAVVTLLLDLHRDIA